MKKTLALILALLCLLSLCACGSEEAAETPAPTEAPAAETPEAAPTEEPVTEKPEDDGTQAAELPEWISLEEGVLTVTLPTVEGGYAWDMDFSAAENAELVTCEEVNGSFVASFRALNDGQCQIYLSYSDGETVAEEREVDILTKDGKVSQLLSCRVDTLDAIMDTALEPELLKLRADNSVPAVVEKKGSMVCISEVFAADGDVEQWQSKSLDRFSMEGGKLRHQSEIYDVDGNPLSYAEYLNGAYFSVVPGLYRSVGFCSAQEYAGFVAEQWLARPEGGTEKILETGEANGMTVIRTEVVYDFYGTRSEYEYIVNDEGLITAITQTDYLIEGGEKLTVTRSTVGYGIEQEVKACAPAEISGAAESCLLKLVINPAQADEEVLEYTVAKDCDVSFMSAYGYEFYADAECTQLLDTVDLSGDSAQVFVIVSR